MLNVNNSWKSKILILVTFASIQGRFLLFIAHMVRQAHVCWTNCTYYLIIHEGNKSKKKDIFLVLKFLF